MQRSSKELTVKYFAPQKHQTRRQAKLREINARNSYVRALPLSFSSTEWLVSNFLTLRIPPKRRDIVWKFQKPCDMRVYRTATRAFVAVQ